MDEAESGRKRAVVEKQLRLLALEETAEKEEQATFLQKLSRQQLQQRGVALYGLRVVERRTGLAGKTIVELANPLRPVLPAHRIKVGEPVQIDSPRSEQAVVGVMCKVGGGSVSVAIKDALPNELGDGLRIVKLANDVSLRRMRSALQQLDAGNIRCPGILNVVFGSGTLQTRIHGDVQSVPSVGWYNSGLNAPQKEAVVRALEEPWLALIHGPPGTGKTETLVEIIRQLVQPRLIGDAGRQRVLVCGPSNLSVDNVIERVAKGGVDLLRVGHPAKVLEAVLAHTLDAKLAAGDAAALVRDIRDEIDAALARLPKSRDKREIYAELRELRKELRTREKGAMETLLKGTAAVFSTLNMAGCSLLRELTFNVVVIDEAGQALEAECWIAILLAEKVILAGDHCQLPPTVTSPEAESGGLGITLFERLVRKRPDLVSMLTIQYRMNRTIMDWSSGEFYGGRLAADARVSEHRLADLPNVQSNELTEPVMLLIDTAGFDYWEAQVAEDQSKYNEEEAELVVRHLKGLVDSGVSAKDVAIVTPYNAQVELIESLLEKREDPLLAGVEVGSGTPDRFRPLPTHATS